MRLLLKMNLKRLGMNHILKNNLFVYFTNFHFFLLNSLIRFPYVFHFTIKQTHNKSVILLNNAYNKPIKAFKYITRQYNNEDQKHIWSKKMIMKNK